MPAPVAPTTEAALVRPVAASLAVKGRIPPHLRGAAKVVVSAVVSGMATVPHQRVFLAMAVMVSVAKRVQTARLQVIARRVPAISPIQCAPQRAISVATAFRVLARTPSVAPVAAAVVAAAVVKSTAESISVVPGLQGLWRHR